MFLTVLMDCVGLCDCIDWTVSLLYGILSYIMWTIEGLDVTMISKR